MQKIYTFILSGIILTMQLAGAAQQRTIDPKPENVKALTPWSLSQTNANGCDTAGWPIPNGQSIVYYNYQNDGGFITGVNQYNDKEKGVLLDLSATPNTNLIKILAGFNKVNGADLTKVVKIKVYDGSGSTPGTELGNIDVTMQQLKDINDQGFAFNIFSLDPVVALPASKKIFITFDISALSWSNNPKDSLALLSTEINQTANNAWEKWSDNTWHDFPSVYQGAQLKIHIYPLISEARSCTPVLPIAWGAVSVKAEGSANVLRWESLLEDNNAGFEIQRSTDGVQFNTIDFAVSKGINGYSTVRNNYTFVDKAPVGSKQYYRLVQLDRDGNRSFSMIVNVSRNQRAGTIVKGIYPNPVQEKLTIDVPGYAGKNTLLQITDITGKMLWQQRTAISIAGNVTIPVAFLPKGMFLVKVQGEDGVVESVKFVKE